MTVRLPRARGVAGACLLLGVLAGCAQSGSGGTSSPNTASSPTVVPGEAPKPGEGASGGITVSGTSIVRTGAKLSVTATIHNGESKPDELLQVGSEVTPTLRISPPLTIPAGGSVSIGGAHKVVLE